MVFKRPADFATKFLFVKKTLHGCEIRLFDPCARVSRVCPGSHGIFLPVSFV